MGNLVIKWVIGIIVGIVAIAIIVPLLLNIAGDTSQMIETGVVTQNTEDVNENYLDKNIDRFNSSDSKTDRFN